MSLLKKAFAKYEKRGQHLQSELGTLEWDTFNPDFLIRIYNMVTFNFLPNPLFFGYITEKSKTGFFKLESPSRFNKFISNGARNFKFPGF